MRDGCSDLNSTDAPPSLVKNAYMQALAQRRQAEEISQLTQFGLTLGWVFTLLGGFCWFCVISRFDVFWQFLMLAGLVLLVLATVLPQGLYWPHRLWMGLAHLQGRLVMTVLLTIVYFGLLSPLGIWERKRRSGSFPFESWNQGPPARSTAWEVLTEPPLDFKGVKLNSLRSRSLLSMLIETLNFFAARGHYLLLPILLFLLFLGLVLFFVQTSALAPFIYTIGTVDC